MKKTASETIAYYKTWLSKYSVVPIEDPFNQDDWEGIRELRCPSASPSLWKAKLERQRPEAIVPLLRTIPCSPLGTSSASRPRNE